MVQDTNSFESLATELVEYILAHLDGRSIAVSSSLCRRFSRIVQSSRKLQYKIELYLQGLAEDPQCMPDDISAAVGALERYKRCWNGLRLPRDRLRVFTFENYHVYPAGRYLIDLSVESSMARLATIPAEGCELEWRELPMKSTNNDRQYSTVGLQGLDMLIVLGVSRALDNNLLVPKISLLDAGTFKPHPLAKSPELEWPEEAGPVENVQWEQMGLSGRTLAVTLHHYPMCVIWDWVAGKPIMVQRLSGKMRNWTLLSDHTFSFTELAEENRVVVLSIHQFDDTGVIKATGRFAFPTVKPGAFIADVFMSTDDVDELNLTDKTDHRYHFVPSTTSQLYGTPGVPMSDSIVGLTISILLHVEDGVLETRELTWTFYMLRSTLLKCGEGDELIPWEKWGPTNTRCLRGETMSIRGCRVVHGSNVPRRNNVTSLLTFTPALCRVSSQLEKNQPSLPKLPSTPRGKVVAFPTRVHKPTVFEKMVETSLPYIIAPPVEDEDLDEDTLTVPVGTISWWEDGRACWMTAADTNIKTISIVTL